MGVSSYWTAIQLKQNYSDDRNNVSNSVSCNDQATDWKQRCIITKK